MEYFQSYLLDNGGFSSKYYTNAIAVVNKKQSVLVKALFLRIVNVTHSSVIKSMEIEGLTALVFDWFQISINERDVYFLQLLLEVFVVIPSARKLIDRIKLLSNFDNPEITKLARTLIVKWSKEKVEDKSEQNFIYIDLDRKKYSTVKRRQTVLRTAGLEEIYTDKDIYDGNQNYD